MHANSDSTGQKAENRICFRLKGHSVQLDRRVHAVRGDLADISLAGLLFAPHYAKAQPMHCIAAGAFLREAPSRKATAVSQLLQGEGFHLLDVTGDWAWGFCENDGYVGYIERVDLETEWLVASHRVTARSAPVFSDASIKTPVLDTLPAGALLTGEIQDDFLMTTQGAIHLRHVAPLDQHASDWVDAAEAQLGQPYVWGGRGHGGIDCSGLVQLALGLAGVRVPRDSDLQRDGLGYAISDEDELRRGDLVFFPSHVGIMLDKTTLLHANAYWMSTIAEPLSDVIDRLKPEHEQPVLARRRIDL